MKLFLGQRVEKNENNQFGWEDKISAETIDRTKPFVICLPGSTTFTSGAINGMCKSIEGMLGISDFLCEDKPCNIYGIYYERPLGTGAKERNYFDKKSNSEEQDLSLIPERNQENIQGIEDFAKQLVEEVFKSIVQDENGQLYKPMEIARGFRNIHFVSFCFGSVVQSAINQELRAYLQSVGLEKEIIELLESQICIIQTAPIASETKTNQTTLNFISLNDEETQNRPIQSKAIEDFNSLQNENLVGGVFASPNNNPTLFVNQFTTIQDEEHSGDFYLHFFENWQASTDGPSYEEKVGGILPLCTAISLRIAMQNAVMNSNSNSFTPLKVEDLVTPCGKYMEWSNYNPQDIPESLLEIYNKNVNYNNINYLKTQINDNVK